MRVYLVVDVGNSPGRVYGVFAEQPAAKDYADQVNALSPTRAEVRTAPLHYGQARWFDPMLVSR